MKRGVRSSLLFIMVSACLQLQAMAPAGGAINGADARKKMNQAPNAAAAAAIIVPAFNSFFYNGGKDESNITEALKDYKKKWGDSPFVVFAHARPAEAGAPEVGEGGRPIVIQPALTFDVNAQRVRNLEEQLAAAQQQAVALNQQLNNANARNEQVQQNLAEALRAQRHAQEELNALRQEMARQAEADRAAQAQAAAEMQAQADRIQAQLQAERDALAQLRAQVGANQQTMLDEFKKRLDDLIADFTRQTNILRDKAERSDAKVAETEQTLKDAQDELAKLRSENRKLQDLQNKNDTLNLDIAGARRTLEAQADKIRALQKQIDDLQKTSTQKAGASVAAVTQELADMKARLAKAQTELDQLRQSRSLSVDAQATIDSLIEQNKKLQEQIEKYKFTAERERDDYEKFVLGFDALREQKTKLTKTLKDANERLDYIEGQLKSSGAEIAKLQAENKKLNAILKEAYAARDRIQKDKREVEQKNYVLINEKNEFVEANRKLAVQIRDLKAQLAAQPKGGATNEALQKQIRDLEAELEKETKLREDSDVTYKKRIKDLNKEIADLEEKLTSGQASAANKSLLDRLQKENDDLRKANLDIRAKNKELSKRIGTLEAQVSTYVDVEDKFKKQVAPLQAQIENCKAEVASKDQYIARLNEQIKLQSQQQSRNKELENLKKENIKLRDINNDLTQRLATVEGPSEELSRLKERLATCQKELEKISDQRSTELAEELGKANTEIKELRQQIAKAQADNQKLRATQISCDQELQTAREIHEQNDQLRKTNQELTQSLKACKEDREEAVGIAEEGLKRSQILEAELAKMQRDLAAAQQGKISEVTAAKMKDLEDDLDALRADNERLKQEIIKLQKQHTSTGYSSPSVLTGATGKQEYP